MLADSSVVTLALPEILARFHVAISTLAWVLIAFNLALALAALPAAYLARRRPVLVFAIGTLVFAAASLVCGLVHVFGVLIAGRAVQGLAGAGVVCGALALLREVTGSDGSAGRIRRPTMPTGPVLWPKNSRPRTCWLPRWIRQPCSPMRAF